MRLEITQQQFHHIYFVISIADCNNRRHSTLHSMGVSQPVDEYSAAPGTPPPPFPFSGLVVGNYCHDVLFRDGTLTAESLGGAAAFISNVFHALDYRCCCRYVSNVGADFAYATLSLPTPSFFPSQTTLFHAHFSSAMHASGYHGDRVLKRVRACDPISPSDLPAHGDDGRLFDFGLAVAVAGEISPATLARMTDLCGAVFVDVQALIRTFDPSDGTVGLVPLRESGFFHLLPRISCLKASADEAPFVDVEEVRKSCCVVITDGKDGCRVYWEGGLLRVPAFPAVQVDPTGAGDSFLGGLVAGILHGLTVTDAALLGNFFGSLTVGQIGVPSFHHEMMQRVKIELQRRMFLLRGSYGKPSEVTLSFEIPNEEHGDFRLFLSAEAAPRSTTDQAAVGDGEDK